MTPDPDPRTGRWLALLSPQGVPPDAARRAFVFVADAYQSPGRHYHTLEHIDDVLAAIDALRSSVQDAVAVELAGWLHDLVYDPRANDNEDRSAAAAAELLGGLRLGPDRIDRIRQQILATRHQPGPLPDADTAALLDADLAVLGSAEDRYVRYARAIRREYAWVPERHYREGRIQVLEGFLNRESIYRTDLMRERHEAAARRNLSWEIETLR
jgi:predicted metal-dependent HD superfamily phosphohydrolase